MSLSDIIPLFGINGIEQELYKDSMFGYTSSNTTLTGSDLPALESILTIGVTTKEALGQSTVTVGGQRASANRARAAAPGYQAQTTSQLTDTISYPPSKAVNWNTVA